MAKQERAVRTRNALIESAAVLFGREGYEVVPLSAISNRAGVSNGALHFHFPSKAALATGVRDEAARRFRRIVSAECPPPQLGGSLQSLVDTSHALLQGLSGDVILRAGFDLGESLEAAGRGEDLYECWHTWVEEAVVRSAREGLLSDVAPRDLAATVVGATVGFAAMGGHDVRWLSRITLTRFWALLLPRVASEQALRVTSASGRQAEAV
ncbi:ScbR family autoregulator-binding transcription factor [Streptomyces sp. NPDC047022]|uniref:ScbR family autoregulator-binding transcription factor n=1 Tax=Streptomyces sp. NPDC047022 TaxID=3155737 RepID=UPI0033CBD0CA